MRDHLAGQERLVSASADLARRLGAAVLVQHVVERDPPAARPSAATHSINHLGSSPMKWQKDRRLT